MEIEKEIQDYSAHMEALANAIKRAKEKLEGVGEKDPREVLEMLYNEVAKSEYKTEVINSQKDTINYQKGIILKKSTNE